MSHTLENHVLITNKHPKMEGYDGRNFLCLMWVWPCGKSSLRPSSLISTTEPLEMIRNGPPSRAEACFNFYSPFSYIKIHFFQFTLIHASK